MGRIIKRIEIEGQGATALFDMGANYTYVRADLVRQAPRRRVVQPVRVALGEQAMEIRKVCLVEGRIEGLPFLTDAVPVADLGEADGQQLDTIIGARTMEQWEIRLDLSTGELDLEGLRRREFKEW